MSITSALARIIAIVGDVRPTVQGLNLGDRLTHDVKGSEVRWGGPGRRFWLQVVDGGGVAPSSAFSRRRRATLALVVEYPNQAAQPQEQDRAVVEDYDAINAALFDGTKWKRPSSSIVAISADGQDLIGPYAIERNSAGWRLRLTFILEYEASTSATNTRFLWWGSTAVDVDTEAEVKALANVAESVDFAPFSVDVALGERAYFVAPVSFGPAEFTVSGFTGGFDLHAVVDVDGVPYNIYRSTNASLGAIDVEVTHV